MSKPLDSHSASGILITVPGVGIMFGYGPTFPPDASAGYAKGCLWLDTDASAGSILLCNEGSITSSDFDAVSVA